MTIPTIALLAISAIAGVILLVPLSSARAASAAITLSATSGAVGASFNVVGSGFLAGKAITLNWDTATLALGGQESILSAGSVTTDSDGNFYTYGVSAPSATAGAHTVKASDGTNSPTATFTITPSISLKTNGAKTLSSGFADETFTSAVFTVKGLAASTTVTFTTSPPFTANVASCTTSSAGTCATTQTITVGLYASTTKISFSATDGTNTATGTFSVLPAVAFYNTQTGGTVFSMLGAAPNSILIEGFGFPAGTIAANSITVGGVATSHASITVGSTGVFGLGAGVHALVAPSGAVPFGLTSVVIGSTTFSFSAGNIIAASAKDSGGNVNTFQPSSTLGASASGTNIKNGWGSPFISTIAATTGSTGVGFLDKSTYTVTGSATSPAITVLGYGFTATVATNTVAASWTTAVGTVPTWFTPTVDANGAFWTRAGTGATTLTGLTDIAYSSSGYTITITKGAGETASAVLSPSFKTSASVSLSFSDGGTAYGATINYKSTGLTVAAHGFGGSVTFTLTTGSTNLLTSAETTTATGKLVSNAEAITTPDLAQAEYTATASDGTITATDTFSVSPLVDGTAGNPAISVTSGAGGTTVQLRTGATYGVHGLAASATYTMVWGIASTSATITTFTTGATGSIPAPGVQFAVPAGAVGYHIVALTSATASPLTGSTDALNGACSSTAGVITGYTCEPSSSQSAVTYTGQYGDLIFSLSASFVATPTVGTVGTSVGITGSGLVPSTTYYLSISTSKTTSGTSAISSYASDAGGNVPASTSITFPHLASTSGSEKGTAFYIHSSTGTQFLTSLTSGFATFILQTSASLSPATQTPGGAVTITATGLANTVVYTVQFNYVSTSSIGTTVTAIVGNSVGDGSGSFTVPSGTAAGAYSIQLMTSTGYSGTNTAVLNSAPTLTVSATAAGGGVTTSSLTSPTTATEASVNGYATIQQTYTNTLSTSVSIFMWASVLNSAGQTVGVFIGSATLSAGQTVTIAAAINNVPSGTYTASVFVTTTTGIVASSTTSTSSFSF